MKKASFGFKKLEEILEILKSYQKPARGSLDHMELAAAGFNG